MWELARLELGIILRRLALRPAFTLAAVVTLGVGIGATAAIFSTVNATLLRPLPFPNSNDLFTLNTVYVDGRFTNGRMAGAYLGAIAEADGVIRRTVAVLRGQEVIRADDGRTRHVLVHNVGTGFFDLFGLPMASGRAPTQEEGRVAVISHRLWDEMFGQDPEVVGRAIRLSSTSVIVVGVARPEFDLPSGTDVWLSGLGTPQTGTGHNYEVYMRVRPGTTRVQLRTELATVMARMGELYPETAGGRAFIEQQLVDAIVGNLRPILLVVLGGAIVLLVLGSVNVAMLILARDSAQARDLAVQAALGASRGRMIGRLLGESFTLAAAGTLFGVTLAFIGVKLLLAFGASELPRLDRVPIDPRVLLFAAGTLVAVAIVVGLTPALRLGNPDIRGLMGEGGRGATGGRGTYRLLSGLIITEIALTTALVAGAGWLVKSYYDLGRVDPGFVSRGRLVFDAPLAGSSFAPGAPQREAESEDEEEEEEAGTPAGWLAELAERLGGSADVTAVGSALTFPLRTEWESSGFIGVPGEYDGLQQDAARYRVVGPGFFEAMGTRVIAGRTLKAGDTGRVVVVNEEFVRRYFAGRSDVIGASFAYGFPAPNFDKPITILGVVADIRYRALDVPAEPTLYAFGQRTLQAVVVATTLSDPSPLIPMVRTAVGEIDPSVPVTIEPVEGIVYAAMLHYRVGLLLMALFAALSMGLAAVGIYGVIAHVVGQRSREMAIRIALGAAPSTIVRQVLGEGRVLAGAGIAIGVAAAYAGGRVISSRLYEVRPGDPVVLMIAVGIVLAVTVLAYLLPALRASRIGPIEALRNE